MHLVRRGGQVCAEVDHRPDGDQRVRVGIPGRELLEEQEPLALLETAGGPKRGGAVVAGGGVEVGVEHYFPSSRKAVLVLGGRTTMFGEEVERGLRASEVTDGDGERRGGVDRLGRVEAGPPCSEVELSGCFGVLDVARGPDRGEQAGGTEGVCLSRCGSCAGRKNGGSVKARGCRGGVVFEARFARTSTDEQPQAPRCLSLLRASHAG